MAITEAFEALLASTPPGQRGGFVIFEGLEPLDYVQFALEETGLLLNWPTIQKGGIERLQQHIEILADRGFVDRSPNDPAQVDRDFIQSLTPGQMCVADDGLYARMDRDAEGAAQLAALILRNVFGVRDLSEVRTILEVDG